ncbi:MULTISPECIES: hypothetical protein [Bradyrhizobium]
MMRSSVNAIGRIARGSVIVELDSAIFGEACHARAARRESAHQMPSASLLLG